MARGLAIICGLNRVIASYWDGWTGKLNACERDAIAIGDIARSQGFETHVLLSYNATAWRVSQLLDRARKLSADDLLFFFYSGHGGQRSDTSGDEADGMDEYFCFAERPMVDDEMRYRLSWLLPRMRVTGLLDMCSGQSAMKRLARARKRGAVKATEPVLPAKIPPVRAGVIHIAASRDGGYAWDGGRHSPFTRACLEVWDGGAFAGTHPQFLQEAAQRTPRDTQPSYFEYGQVTARQRNARPFVI